MTIFKQDEGDIEMTIFDNMDTFEDFIDGLIRKTIFDNVNTFEDFIDGLIRKTEVKYYADAGDAYEFRVEIPGVKKENVTVTPKNNQIEITALRKLKDGREDKKKGTYSIPPNVDMERADAYVEDGVLTIRLPKTQVNSPRMIPIR